MLQKQTYILAISGGVDSIVLLDMLAKKRTSNITYVVAHYDHGIRPDSAQGAIFTAQIANNLQFEIEIGHGNLGAKASEALAREKRYEFLRSVMDKHKAEKIVTAHHQDDVLETMVINILRGTGPRGLMPMLKPSDILRPLLNKSKAELYDYAAAHNLLWKEDSTNNDMDYLRNHVRKNILPKLAPSHRALLATRARLGDLYYEIDQLLRLATPKMNLLHRPSFLAHSFVVQREVLRAWLMKMGVTQLDRRQIERLTIACKTMPIGKKIDVDNVLWLVSQPQNLQIIKKDHPENV